LGSIPELYGVNAAGKLMQLPSACRIQAWSSGGLLNLIDEAPLV
jgi:glycogen debranching enzyme